MSSKLVGLWLQGRKVQSRFGEKVEFDDIDSENGSQGSENGNVNPAWNEVLDLIPEEVRPQVLPTFQKWDSNFQGQVQKVHSEYEPYKFLKEGEVPADDVRMAMGIMEAIQNDPRSVYDSLASSFGYNSVDDNAGNNGGTGSANNSGQGSSGQQNAGNELTLPTEVQEQLKRLQTGHDTMAQIILAEQQKQEEENRDKTLRDEIDQLRDKHGKFDEEYVLGKMLNGVKPEDAVQAYKDFVKKIVTENRRPPAPQLLSPGNGGTPGQGKVDVTKLSESDTKNLVANYLRDSQASNQ